ncbi:MAG: inorganic diphosphatase [Thiotrichaceae bacterium]|nr:inorganic diphosphatase [Thiotrichaceae bacterium]
MTDLKRIKNSHVSRYSVAAHKDVPLLEVIIEIPRGSFLKRGSTGELDFISPLPCPFNYGSIPLLIGLEGDLLDAVVLGPRLPLGTKVKIYAWGAIGLTDRGMYDDKLICSHLPIPVWKKRMILLFFIIYARAKSLLNLIRGQKGRNRCEGWQEAKAALARATPYSDTTWTGSKIFF